MLDIANWWHKLKDINNLGEKVVAGGREKLRLLKKIRFHRRIQDTWIKVYNILNLVKFLSQDFFRTHELLVYIFLSWRMFLESERNFMFVICEEFSNEKHSKVWEHFKD